MKDAWLQLSKIEVFFIVTTVLSLFVNLFQFMIWWRDQKQLFRPMSNSLVALFNDIKAKALNAYFVQNTLWNSNNPHADIGTLKWEYGAYTQAVITHLQGFQETVVGILATLNPKDKDGTQTFRAADFGLTGQERELKRKNFERIQDQWTQPHNQPAPPAPETTESDDV